MDCFSVVFFPQKSIQSWLKVCPLSATPLLTWSLTLLHNQLPCRTPELFVFWRPESETFIIRCSRKWKGRHVHVRFAWHIHRFGPTIPLVTGKNTALSWPRGSSIRRSSGNKSWSTTRGIISWHLAPRVANVTSNVKFATVPPFSCLQWWFKHQIEYCQHSHALAGVVVFDVAFHVPKICRKLWFNP